MRFPSGQQHAQTQHEKAVGQREFYDGTMGMRRQEEGAPTTQQGLQGTLL